MDTQDNTDISHVRVVDDMNMTTFPNSSMPESRMNNTISLTQIGGAPQSEFNEQNSNIDQFHGASYGTLGA